MFTGMEVFNTSMCLQCASTIVAYKCCWLQMLFCAHCAHVSYPSWPPFSPDCVAADPAPANAPVHVVMGCCFMGKWAKKSSTGRPPPPHLITGKMHRRTLAHKCTPRYAEQGTRTSMSEMARWYRRIKSRTVRRMRVGSLLEYSSPKYSASDLSSPYTACSNSCASHVWIDIVVASAAHALLHRISQSVTTILFMLSSSLNRTSTAANSRSAAA